MGQYDDITPDELRNQLLRFARLVQKMDEEGMLLERGPSLMKLLGNLRQMMFAYEVRGTGNLLPPEEGEDEEPPPEDPGLRDSQRIVREALERQEELQDELEDRLFPGEEEESD